MRAYISRCILFVAMCLSVESGSGDIDNLGMLLTAFANELLVMEGKNEGESSVILVQQRRETTCL